MADGVELAEIAVVETVAVGTAAAGIDYCIRRAQDRWASSPACRRDCWPQRHRGPWD